MSLAAVAARRAMRARAEIATTLSAGRTALTVLRSSPPLTLRQTGPVTVHLVSTAAGPLGGDELELDLRVAPGTTLEVGSIASTLVLPGEGPSSMTVTAHVGAGASLRFAPEPTVLADGCDHRMAVRLSLDGDARVWWREEVVMGRYGEAGGRCVTRFDATAGGRPLLRQELELGTGPCSPAVLGGARCVGSVLTTRPCDTAVADGAVADGAVADGAVADGVVVMPLAGPGTLVQALAADAVELRERLDWGLAQVPPS
ncbi:urease accessory protein UreD [Nonomuraea soli]|uniref:Urease accessory protein UreD n=1 Tax=Nonomuraea soli TaxID=1032476 RepID=A0A7W0CDD1_9ACTN|nr:urease accessory protein UreD [Nonomuraea soli]MBA2889084.1 urease accessory protein [Nonomuraea soli]